MKILVYDVAASKSGALGILNEYYERALLDNANEYVFVVSTPELDDAPNIKVRRYPDVKKGWLNRLLFDVHNAPSIVEEEAPEEVLSLQNMGIPRIGCRQVVYEHNCMFKPFTDIRFSFFDERNLWLRQNIIGYLVSRSLKKADLVIVQSEWMKRRCVGRLGLSPDNVKVERPALAKRPECTRVIPDKPTFFYPATGVSFKNHQVILSACELLFEAGFSGYQVVLTLTGDENKRVARMKRKIDEKSLPIAFKGWMSIDQVYEMYARSVLLYPSKLESFSLPLLEATQANAPIIAADTEYAHETLAGYRNAVFFNPDDPVELAGAMSSYLYSHAKNVTM